MDNASRFINAFAMIETECRRIVGDGRYTKFYMLLEQAAKINSTIRQYQIDLQEYADLRNAIVHERTEEGTVIAQPVDWVVERIEKIARLLSSPALLKDHFLKPVKTCRPEDSVLDAYQLMKTLGTSKLPIYTEGRFFGLLTLEMIAEWAVFRQAEDEVPSVQTIFKPQVKTEKVLFLSKEATVETALEMFEETMRRGVHLLAIIISAEGERNQKPEGILTIADLQKMISYID